MMLTGRPYGEPTVLAIGEEYQLATSWHERRPPRASAGHARLTA